MKKFLVIAVIAALYLYFGGGGNSSADSRYSVAGSQYSAAEDGPIVMYSTSWCGVCRTTRDFFEAEDIDYVEYDIERSEKRYREYSELGGRGVPLVKIGDETIHGYNPTLMLAMIGPR